MAEQGQRVFDIVLPTSMIVFVKEPLGRWRRSLLLLIPNPSTTTARVKGKTGTRKELIPVEICNHLYLHTWRCKCRRSLRSPLVSVSALAGFCSFEPCSSIDGSLLDSAVLGWVLVSRWGGRGGAGSSRICAESSNRGWTRIASADWWVSYLQLNHFMTLWLLFFFRWQ